MMKEIITDEFLQYKTGFISGKGIAVEIYKLGKMMDFNKINQPENDKNWYFYGKLDGTKYFLEKFLLPDFDLATVNTKEVVTEKFVERVTEMNQNEASSIPIGKFRM